MEALVRGLQDMRLRYCGQKEGSMHIAAVLRAAPLSKVNWALILSIGMNSRREKQSTPYWGPLHAECDAVGKLPRHAGRRPLAVHLLVVRTNRSGGTASSQPCRDCLVRIRRMAEAKNITVSKLWFTDERGNLVATTRADRLPPHVSYAFRTTSRRMHAP